MSIIFGFFPVVLFLGCLFLLDSFKLVKIHILLLCLVWGIASAGLSYLANTYTAEHINIGFETFSRYVAPFTEELLKVILIVFLVTRKQIGFMIDAAIYGFAIGAGFALAENLYYVVYLGHGFDAALAIVRGFGTAIMHGGTISVCSMILIEGVQRISKIIPALAPGFLIAIILHSAFNQFMLNPLLQTLLIITMLPAVFYVVFARSTRNLQQWLEVEFSTEVDMLRMIRVGRFSETKSGNYLASLKHHFSPEMVVDMYCFISLYLDLSIKAKRNLMLRETGFDAIYEADMQEKLNELKQLRKNIGKTGEMALLPLVRMNYREFWKLNQLRK
ncbi:MAG: PrsW family glutamic-type intramembrane protease [Bacteroidales bacterium]|nr:PrsW family glutamic-type intramembrane protease [Bacteroidales bacterium]